MFRGTIFIQGPRLMCSLIISEVLLVLIGFTLARAKQFCDKQDNKHFVGTFLEIYKILGESGYDFS